ncbi:MAG TPA: AIR synthase-related protein [archaeon]|nr:AIR synthase-related protein [archaeon]
MSPGMDYRSAGVNLELGDDASRVLYEAARHTWKNRNGKLGEVVTLFDDFSGLRAVHVGGLPSDAYINMGFDGIGTKTEIAERTGRHDTAAYDLFAMVCDDAVRYGAEPVLVGSVLDVRTLEENGESYIGFVKELAKGYIDAAREANVAIVNGEIAELGARVQGYGPFNYNWGAGLVWFGRKGRMITGKDIKHGDYLVALKENGFRSNGLSLVRKVLGSAHGSEWQEETYNGEKLGELVLHPSRIYSGAVSEMFGGFDGEPKAKLHGVAHITGGGVPGKLGRVLKPTGYGAEITDPFEPADVMLYVQDKGNVTDAEAYRTWNMGQGMIIVTPEPDKAMAIAGARGIVSKIIGQISPKPGIRIHSKGINAAKNGILEFS